MSCRKVLCVSIISLSWYLEKPFSCHLSLCLISVFETFRSCHRFWNYVKNLLASGQNFFELSAIMKGFINITDIVQPIEPSSFYTGSGDVLTTILWIAFTIYHAGVVKYIKRESTVQLVRLEERKKDNSVAMRFI